MIENILTEEQKVNVENGIAKLNEKNLAIDISIMGSGKTISSLGIYEIGKYDYLIVICPSNLVNNWKIESKKYKIKINNIVSYEILRGIKGHKIKHNLLERMDEKSGPVYEVTDFFKELVSEKKCLIILDEFHHLMNENYSHKALKTLNSYLLENNVFNSGILALSGTPFDTKTHTINCLRCLGIIENETLYKYNRKGNYLELLGAFEVIEYCKKINEEKTNEIMDEFELNPKNVEDFIYTLFVNIIEKEIIICMDVYNIEESINLYCYNTFYNFDENDLNKINESIELLTNELDSKINWKKIDTALVLNQLGKINKIVDETKKILDDDYTSKVCIYFDYDKPIDLCMIKLKDYNPVKFNGKVDKKFRQKIIDDFQEDSSDSRLLILNSAVGSEGINLDDTSGNRRRFVFACPNHHIKRTHQMIRRFYRLTTKSSPTINIVYSNDNPKELSLINSLSTKSTIMKETLQKHVDSGIKFPIDYDTKYETEPYVPEIFHKSETTYNSIPNNYESIKSFFNFPSKYNQSIF